MRRGISSMAALVATLSTNQQAKSIEQNGGLWVEKPNREQRRRMEREERRSKKQGGQHADQ